MEGILSGLIIGWILSFFGFNNMFVEVVQPYVTVTLSISHYYIIFACLGFIAYIMNRR